MLMTISNTDFLELCPKLLMMMTMIIKDCTYLDIMLCTVHALLLSILKTTPQGRYKTGKRSLRRINNLFSPTVNKG